LPRASHAASRDRRPGPAGARRRQPPRRPRHRHHQQHHDGRGASCQHHRIGANTRVRLGQPGRPDRHQRRRGDRHPGSHDRTGGGGCPDFDQPRCHQLPAGQAQRRQRRGVRGGRGQQAGGGLADDQQRGDPQDQCEHTERGRLGPDRTLDGRGLCPLVSDEHAASGLGKLARQCLSLAPERHWGGSRPQFDENPIGARILIGEPVEQRQAGHDGQDLVVFGDGKDRSAGDHNAHHPFAQQAGGAPPGRDDTGQRTMGDCPHGQHAAHLQAHHGRPALVDHDLTRAIRRRQPPGEHLGHINISPQPPIKGHQGQGVARGPAATAKRPQVQARHHRHVIHVRQQGNRAEIAVQAGEIRHDEQVRGFGGRQETRIGAFCPRRPRGRGQNRTPGEGHQRSQHRPAPPPGTQLVSGQINDGPHPITRRTRPRQRRPPWARR
jgi:hypothetical protein